MYQLQIWVRFRIFSLFLYYYTITWEVPLHETTTQYHPYGSVYCCCCFYTKIYFFLLFFFFHGNLGQYSKSRKLPTWVSFAKNGNSSDCTPWHKPSQSRCGMPHVLSDTQSAESLLCQNFYPIPPLAQGTHSSWSHRMLRCCDIFVNC